MRETGRPAPPRARSRRRRRRPWRWPNRKSTDAGAATNVPCLPSNGWGSCAVLSARSPRHLPAAGRRGPQETMGSREETPEMGFKDAARRLLGGVLFVATAVMAGPALARAVLALDEARQPVPLLDAGDAWIDATGAARVEDVAGNAGLRWEPTHDDAIYRISTGQALWLRFTVPPSRNADRWYLEIPYPSVDRVTPYLRDAGGHWVAQAAAGDTIAVADWPEPHRYPRLPLAVSPDQPRDYLLRVEDPHSYSAPLAFVNADCMRQHGQRTSLVLGIYFGLAGLAAVLGVLSAVS